jgi:ADP-heptose:LPS heptosyltransferase
VTVVVLRDLGLGDLLTAVPALRAIAEAFPDDARVLVGPPELAPLMPLFANVRGGHSQPWRMEDVARQVDVAVNLHGRGPQSTRALRALRPPHLIAFGERGSAWRDREHEVHRWCRLLEENGIPADRARLDLPRLHSAGNSPPPVWAIACRTAVVHPGAAFGSRRWPAGRWAEVARGIRERGFDVVITGSGGEAALANGIARAAGLARDRVLAGRTDVVALARLVGGASLVVSGDTGIAHLATAMGTPSVTLFGPVSPAEWGPPRDRLQHRAVWRAAAGDYRGDPRGDTLDPVLAAITADEVLQALDSLDSLDSLESVDAAGSHACKNSVRPSGSLSGSNLLPQWLGS